MKIKYKDFSRKEKLHYVEKQLMIFLSGFFMLILAHILLSPALSSIVNSHLSGITFGSFTLAIFAGYYFITLVGALFGLILAEKLQLYTPYDFERIKARQERIRIALIDNELEDKK